MLGTSLLPVLLIASRIASASALNADSDLTKAELGGQLLIPYGFEGVPVMVILAPEAVNMKRHPSGDGKRVENMGDHLR